MNSSTGYISILHLIVLQIRIQSGYQTGSSLPASKVAGTPCPAKAAMATLTQAALGSTPGSAVMSWATALGSDMCSRTWGGGWRPASTSAAGTSLTTGADSSQCILKGRYR